MSGVGCAGELPGRCLVAPELICIRMKLPVTSYFASEVYGRRVNKFVVGLAINEVKITGDIMLLMIFKGIVGSTWLAMR